MASILLPFDLSNNNAREVILKDLTPVSDNYEVFRNFKKASEDLISLIDLVPQSLNCPKKLSNPRKSCKRVRNSSLFKNHSVNPGCWHISEFTLYKWVTTYFSQLGLFFHAR